jgi:RimJ/RimL family protein N-acetyltransferase
MLTGQNIYLRGLELTDVTELMKFWNNKEIRQFLHAYAPNSVHEEQEWIRNTWAERKKGRTYVFGIITKAQDLYIGNIEISIVNQISRRGNLGIVIFNPAFWNKGYGTEAVQLILTYGFKTLNLHSIELEVFDNNPRAQRCYEKVGFQKMGRRRESVYSDGKYIDSLLLDITSTEWEEKHTSND